MKNFRIFFFIILIISITIIFIKFKPEYSILNITRIILLIIILGFISILFLLICYRLYEKIINKLNPKAILFLIYFLLIVNMILGSKVYSIEWAFLGFLLSAIIFYDAKIDSRYLILPSLILLGYVPFLLVGKFEAIAETIAIYVYYYLVVGVGLQFIEYLKDYESKLIFENIKNFLNSTTLSYLLFFVGLITIMIIILNRLYPLEFWKWTSVYVFTVIIIFYILSIMSEKDIGK